VADPVPMARGRKSMMMGTSAFDAASYTSVELGGWHPSIRSPDGALWHEQVIIDARTRDLSRNSSHATTGVKRKTDNVLGANVRLQVQPDWQALGITADAARALAKNIEAEWRLYTMDPGKYVDASRRLTFGGLARVLYWHHCFDGRALTLPVWLPKRGGRYGTAFQLVDPLRLCNPRGMPDAWNMRGGVEIDRYGAPVAYNIRNQHPGDLILSQPGNSYSWTRIPSETSWGRKRVIHWFNQEQAEQTNGISMLVPAMKRLKMLETRSDLELQAAAINATFAAFVKSALPSDALFNALTTAPDGSDDSIALITDYSAFQNAYYDQRGYTLNGSRVGHLLPGEEFQTVSSDRAGTAFEASERVWLRSVASDLDLSYEQLSGDWSQVNYSSARALLNEIWKGVLAEREMFGDGVLTPMFTVWLEEAIETGRVVLPKGAPSFAEARGAYCRLVWTGPGRGYIDPKKERDAESTARNGGNLTLRDALAEDGADWEEHVEQLAREQDALKAAGLPYPGQLPPPPPNPSTDEPPDEAPPVGGKP
jgi:lambda family phage portal protein